jgi:hypothetical protein
VKNGMLGILLMVGMCLAAQGCTYRAWYEGFQKQQREECYKQPTPEEVRKCLDQVNNMTYDQYTKARQDSEKKGE